MLKWTVTAKQRTDDKRVTSKLSTNRRSLSVLAENGGNIRTPKNIKNLKSRRSLGSCSQQTTNNLCNKLNNNKENRNLIASTPYRVTNLINNRGALQPNTGGSQLNLALRDVSNLTPSSTPVTTPTSHTHRKRLHCDIVSPTPKRPPQYASTLPSYDVEYSPCEIQTAPYFAIRGLSIADSYYENPRYFNQDEPQSTLPPPSKKIKSIVNEGVTPLSSRLSDLRFSKISLKRKSIAINNVNQEGSLSSSVLGDTALEKMIDAILESAKKEKKTITPKINKFRIFNNNDILSNNNETTPTYKSAEDPASDLIKYSNDIILSPSKILEANNRTIIINDDKLGFNEREVKTPDSELSFCLKRHKAVRRKIHKINDRIGLTIPNGLPNLDDNSDVHRRDTNMIGLTLPNGIPSPETPAHYNIIQKSYDQLAEMETPNELGVTTNNNNSSSTEINSIDLQGSSTPTGVITCSRRCLTFSPAECSSQENSIDKRRSVASSTASRISKNCLVTGSLDIAIFLEDNAINVHVIRCRDLCRPNGNSINAYVKVAILPSENEIGFQRTAVHRNSSRPYFDHRFKFDLKETLDCNTNKRIQLAVWHRDRECKRSEFLGCMSFPVKNVIQKEINGSFKLQPQTCLTNPAQPIPVTLLNHQQLSTNSSASLQPPIMCENSQSSVEEAISIDDGAGDRDRIGDENNTEQMNNNNNNNTTSTTTGQTTIAFSKKAIHQRDADENLFLRFLELDPPIEIVPASNSSGGNRRQSSIRQNAGRTPFTITKKLVRTNDKGFGFSIVWTHPPRIEKVEPGLSADKSGVVPGDYVIFVDKHNVVTMPEMDILNLIRSQGNILILEIFRRPSTSSNYSNSSNNNRPTNGIKLQTHNIINSNPKIDIDENIKNVPVIIPVTPSLSLKTAAIRTSTVCSSVETTSKRKLNLPQVTFSKESILLPTIDDQRRKIIYQLVHREQNLVTALQFGMERFVIPMRDRKDIISPNDHRTLFQNIDELLRISEDILEQLVQEETEPPLNFISRVYLSKTTALCAAYKKYCNGLKRADCVLVNKSRNSNSDFMNFILEPTVPRKRPDLTTFIHRPLQHFREILKLIQITATHCRAESEECRNFNSVINDLQAAYREITVGGGLMEPLGEGRPLLTLQDLESRLVFTRCKPFVLASPTRQWIFGGDLSRVEGRSIKPYWTLLFSDILLFAKVSRDRVLFITEEPLPLSNITDSCFNIRKKATEFRITIDPNGRLAESPTAHCAPDITRTPRRNARRRSIILRAPSPELKAVWQNLLQRQIFLVNAALGSTPLSSPLESPDVMHTFVPLCDIGGATTSMASIKLSSLDSLPLKVNSNSIHHNHQQTSSKDSSEASKQLEELIDEKCRLLNKSGTSKGGALHLAQWMKGQLDKESERNPIVECTNENRDEMDDDEERVIDWSPEKLKQRSRELQLVDANGVCQSIKHEVGKRCDSRIEEQLLSEIDEESKSPSRSTTSDSQITVRSSPIANSSNLDNSKRCLKCHKNCAKSSTITTKSSSISSASHNSVTNSSLKVQHSQSSPNRCCTTTKISNSSQASINLNNMNSNDSINNSDSSNKIQHKTTNNNCITNDDDIIKTQAVARNFHLTNGNCTEKEKEKIKILESQRKKCHIPCKCKCEPSDFNQTKLSPDEIIHEKCKLYDNESKLRTKTSKHIECRCVCTFTSNIATTKIEKTDDVINKNNNSDNNNCNNNSHNKNNNNSISNNIDNDDDSDWSMMLIGLAQINPTSSLVHIDPFEAVPTISVVPPTPESLTSRFSHLFGGSKSRSEDDDISPEDSPQDEEPPYKVLNTSLRRYGTMSSLEKVPSEDTDDKTYNSSDDDEENDNEELDHDDENVMRRNGEDDDDDDDDIKIVTKEIYNANNSQSLRNWTARAGSYVAEKMSFLEESKAFFDKYLGRVPQSNEQNDEELLDECTSGATSGEDVWGTPTSGGENEDMHMFNSDQTHSSPTKSSSSLTGDDDTELMMDELLMAPPMTASTVRGLLPRRRLEPLFEEDTESAEESEEEEDEDDDEDDDELNNDGGNFNQERQDGMEKDLRTGGRNLLNLVEKPEKMNVVDELVTMRMNMKIDLAPQEGSSGHSTPVITPVERIEMEMTKKTTTPINEEERIKEIIKSYGSAADTLSTVGEIKKDVRDYVASIEFVEKIKTKVPPDSNKEPKVRKEMMEGKETESDLQQKSKGVYVVSGLSPRLEMRLALNQDIMDDEDLINYEPGPQSLTKILGHDLSTYHRRTPKDLLMNPPHRSITLSNSHHPSNLSSGQLHLLQQKNSKMDTPTPNRKKSSLSIWSSSASVDLVDESMLTDLERLARREKMFSMSQLRSGRVAPQQPDHKTRKLGGNDKQSTSSLELQIRNNKKNKFFNFLSRRNSSDSHILKFFSKEIGEDDVPTYLGDKDISPRKDVDKSLDRRFWKQLSKRRRSSSVSEISATS